MKTNDFSGLVDPTALADNTLGWGFITFCFHAPMYVQKMTACQGVCANFAHHFYVRILHNGVMDTDWFRKRMKRLGLHDPDLGNVIGRERSVVNKMINKGAPRLKVSDLEPWSKLLRVSIPELIWRAGQMDDRPPLLQVAPVISAVQAGAFGETFWKHDELFERTILVEYPRETVFALEVEGDSMDRITPEGSLAVVDYKIRDPHDGRLYVVRKDSESTLKRYRTDGEDAWLEPDSTNRRHQSLFFDGSETIEIVGQVIEIRPIYNPDLSLSVRRVA